MDSTIDRKFLTNLDKQKTKIIYADKCTVDDSVLKNVSCICIVQHHDISKQLIDSVYHNSRVPLIYDCQNKLQRDFNSKTILESFGR